MQKRTLWATLAACFVLVGVLVISGASGATATQGMAVIAGQPNSETAPTEIHNDTTREAAFGDGLDVFSNNANGSTGVFGDGDSGVVGSGNAVGVSGVGSTGVLGQSLTDGDGVRGLANNSCCSAVFGHNDGTGNGVAGQADTGTGVLAASTGGTALKVDGKAQFSRSGTATITGSSTTPKSSIVVNNVAHTSKSLVMVTPQKNVAGVWVQAAVPNVSNSRFTIFLNKTVTVSYPVAWFIVEKP